MDSSRSGPVGCGIKPPFIRVVSLAPELADDPYRIEYILREETAFPWYETRHINESLSVGVSICSGRRLPISLTIGRPARLIQDMIKNERLAEGQTLSAHALLVEVERAFTLPRDQELYRSIMQDLRERNPIISFQDWKPIVVTARALSYGVKGKPATARASIPPNSAPPTIVQRPRGLPPSPSSPGLSRPSSPGSPPVSAASSDRPSDPGHPRGLGSFTRRRGRLFPLIPEPEPRKK